MMSGVSNRLLASGSTSPGCSRVSSTPACSWRVQPQPRSRGCYPRAPPGCLGASSRRQEQQRGDDPEGGESEVKTGSPELVVQRVSETGASRKAFSRAFTKLLGLELADPDKTDPASLFTTNFPAYMPALSTIKVQQKREYVTGRTYTDTDVGYLAFFVAMHAAALIGGPLTFSQDALEVCLAGYVITGMFGISMSYHRQLSHKSFRCPKWLEFTLAYCGVLAFEGDPVEWTKNHRWHHLHSDSNADRHSPRDGLWHSHMGWLFDEQLTNTRKDGSGNMKDSLSPPWFFKESPEFYTWIRQTYMYHQLGQAVFFLLLGGVPYLIWGFVIRILLTMHMTWLVNSVVHVWGSREYESNDNSRNNPLVALLVFGDGWHNNHHAFEYSAAHGLEWWQLDPSYCVIRALELAGLAWDVKRPSEAQMKKAAIVPRQ